jgi:hypothetical protein
MSDPLGWMGGHKIKTPPPTTAVAHLRPAGPSCERGGPGVALAPDYINPCYRMVPPLKNTNRSALSDNCPVDYVRRRKGHVRPLNDAGCFAAATAFIVRL